ncbi:MAG TPA: hypothetical protein VFM55_16995 [Micromonosporaceae bacterium]|nr:hypothetical protein [Micromonosporaceae bacterium]
MDAIPTLPPRETPGPHRLEQVMGTVVSLDLAGPPPRGHLSSVDHSRRRLAAARQR